MASLPPPDRALLMTFYIALKHISMTWKYRKVNINNCMKAENLNIYHSWEWSQHGFTYRSQEVLLKNPLDGYDMYVLCSITCFCLLSTLYHDFAWCFLDYTSAVPLYYVFHRPMNYVRVSDVFPCCRVPIMPSRPPSTAMEAEWNQRNPLPLEFPSSCRALPLQSWANLPEGHGHGQVMSSWGHLRWQTGDNSIFWRCHAARGKFSGWSA